MVQLNAHRRNESRATPRPKAVPGNTSGPLVGAILLCGTFAIVVARWLTSTGYRPVPFGLPDPGPLTSIGLPTAQFVHELAGIAVVGLLFLRVIRPTLGRSAGRPSPRRDDDALGVDLDGQHLRLDRVHHVRPHRRPNLPTAGSPRPDRHRGRHQPGARRVRHAVGGVGTGHVRRPTCRKPGRWPRYSWLHRLLCCRPR